MNLHLPPSKLILPKLSSQSKQPPKSFKLNLRTQLSIPNKHPQTTPQSAIARIMKDPKEDYKVSTLKRQKVLKSELRDSPKSLKNRYFTFSMRRRKKIYGHDIKILL
jgi:hypothetical protein